MSEYKNEGIWPAAVPGLIFSGPPDHFRYPETGCKSFRWRCMAVCPAASAEQWPDRFTRVNRTKIY